MKIHDLASQGDHDGLRNEIDRGAWVDDRDERDYTPLACAASSPKADVESLRLLIGAGADVNVLVDEGKHFPLELAACSGSQRKVQILLDAGAKVNFATAKGYTALIKVVYALYDDTALVSLVDLLVKSGADINRTTDYGEFPLGVASRLGRFDAVRYLIAAGADPSPLGWSALMQAIAVGTGEDVERLLASAVDLTCRDRFARTLLILAAAVGDVGKMSAIFSKGVDIDQRARMGQTALMIAATYGRSDVVQWLVSHGAEIDAVDDSWDTALMSAAERGSTDCVRILLAAGAKPTLWNSNESNAMRKASNEAIVRLLVEAGEDIGDANTETKRMLLGLNGEPVWTIDKSAYESGCRPRFGTSNPEVMDIPFWHEMVRAGVCAYSAKMQFGVADILAGPVWCFERYGMSFTELPDGRFVQIGGEHEDFYDPDFCIYNDVVIHDRTGSFQILGYPRDLFPPTDFHSATYIDGVIYIVGGLRYQGERRFGTTPVYRLDCQTWRMEVLTASGDKPGWIFNHRASFDGTGAILFSGGTICVEVDGEEQHVENEEQFRLDLRSMKWTHL